MYVCRTFERTVTCVAPLVGVWAMIPAPSLLALPSIPRQRRRRAGVSGWGFEDEGGGWGWTYAVLLGVRLSSSW